MGMYKLLSGISLLARIYLCYVTIDTIPIFANELVNYMVLEILSLYTILRIITYFENKVIINRLDIKSSCVRVFIYFIIYCLNLAILYGIMSLLTKYGILPIII